MQSIAHFPEDLIALSLVPGAGRKAVHRAMRMATRQDTRIATFFGKPISTLMRAISPGEESAAEALARCGDEQRNQADWLLRVARESAIRWITVASPEYPTSLARALADQTPPLLFFQGNEALLHGASAAVVGTRRPTLEAGTLAEAAAACFAAEGIPVVSGGARGIDERAHQSVLNNDGCTIVILPEGLHPYDAPSFIRAGLQRGQVLLVSEFLPTDGWQTHRAMTRNKTIAALANLLCVIEPREKSGSMFTAMQALNQSKPVFYWGGACRDGALKDHATATRLADRWGRVRTGDLLRAVQHRPVEPPGQFGLFD